VTEKATDRIPGESAKLNRLTDRRRNRIGPEICDVCERLAV
jgi:hypothetical protein